MEATNILAYYKKKNKEGSFLHHIETNQKKVLDAKEFIASGAFRDKCVIEFKPSARCNFQCSYCDFRLNSENDLTEANFKNYLIFLKKHLDKYKFKKIHFFVHGGDPLMYNNLMSNILEFVETFKMYKIDILIQTNGFSWNLKTFDKNIQILKNMNIQIEFGISYHEEFTKFTELYDRIKILRKYDMYYVIAYMLTKNNISKNLKTIRKFEILKINTNIRPIIQDKKFITDNYRHLITELNGDQQNEELFSIINNDDEIQKITFEQAMELDATNFNGWYCAAGIDGLILSHSGHIYRCNVDALFGKFAIYDANDDRLIDVGSDCKQNYCNMFRTCKSRTNKFIGEIDE